MSLGPWQIVLIALVVILLFGAGKIPRLMGDAAKGINAFKKGLKEDKTDGGGDTVTKADGGDVVEDASKKDETAKS